MTRNAIHISSTASIRVLLADNIPTEVCVIRRALTYESDMVLIGAVGSAERLIAMTADLRPDVVIVDLGMPGLLPLDAVSQLASRHPEVGIVACGVRASPAQAEAAIDAGADRFVANLTEIVATVRDVAGAPWRRSHEALCRAFETDLQRAAQVRATLNPGGPPSRLGSVRAP